ncbi:MAG: hypothetical protein R3Y54_04910 [Eubacteriales bacterium]
MPRKKITKGMYGYRKEIRIKVLIITVIMFLLSLAMYGWGYYHVGTVQSYYTVLAVLGMLPASKSLVNVIMYCKAKECAKQVYEQVAEIPCKYPMLYSLYLTMYEHSTRIDCVHIYDKHMVLLVENPVKGKVVEAHIKKILPMHHLQGTSVKVIHELETYKNRIQQLNQKYQEEPTEKTQLLIQLMKQITI